MNKLYTRVSGHPTCDVLLEKYSGRSYFKAGDDLKGCIIIKTRVDGQKIEHQGIRVSLLGMVLQLPLRTMRSDQFGFTKSKSLEDGTRGQVTASNISQYR